MTYPWRRNEAIERVLGEEGGYIDDPSDPGGETNWGITEAVARQYGYTGDMSDLLVDTAKQIYIEEYWERCRLDDVAPIAPRTAGRLFDMAVSMGPSTAMQYFQRSLNGIGVVDELSVDGLAGPRTQSVLVAVCNRYRDADDLLVTALRGLQVGHYEKLANGEPATFRQYFAGWLRRLTS